MGFIAGAIIIDCITSNRSNSDAGSGGLGSVCLLAYLIYKLPKMENYLLNATKNNEFMLIGLLIGCTILIPIYTSFIRTYKRASIAVIVKKLIIYIDVLVGLLIMIIISNKLGVNPASYIFNIDRVGQNINSHNFFISGFSLMAYPAIKFLDIVLILTLIPILQFTIYYLIRKKFFIVKNK